MIRILSDPRTARRTLATGAVIDAEYEVVTPARPGRLASAGRALIDILVAVAMVGVLGHFAANTNPESHAYTAIRGAGAFAMLALAKGVWSLGRSLLGRSR